MLPPNKRNHRTLIMNSYGLQTIVSGYDFVSNAIPECSFTVKGISGSKIVQNIQFFIAVIGKSKEIEYESIWMDILLFRKNQTKVEFFPATG